MDKQAFVYILASQRNGAQCCFAQDEPVKPAVPDQKAKRVPENRGLC